MTQHNLFGEQNTANAFAASKDAGKTKNPPLADLLRPQELGDIAGQEQLLGPQGSITKMLESGHIQSMILWGPPGCGKTTIARLIARESGMPFETISAIFSGVSDLKKIFTHARDLQDLNDGASVLLFVDEIHRFNKAQQDAFLPHIESGLITLIGATTENPSFSLNPAILSRCPVQVLKRLSDNDLLDILSRAEKRLDLTLPLEQEARVKLVSMADGDARFLLNMLETLILHTKNAAHQNIEVGDLAQILQRRSAVYDSNEESHYNLISALHKSVRGSDPDAALYWFARMLEGGEDPHFLARRITRMAAEDIGLASPQGLSLCISAWQTYERLGSPEGELALAQALVYLATSPKSNAVYTAYKAARKAAKEYGSLMPPAHILNAPTKMMKDIGYGDGYMYDPDIKGGISGQNYFPDAMPRPTFYAPKGDGFEKEIKNRLEHINTIRNDVARKSKKNT